MQYQIINAISIIVIAAFIVRTIRNTIYHLYLWQNKEYRLDRMFVHFKMSQGIKMLIGPISLIKTILLIAFIGSSLKNINPASTLLIWIFSLIIVIEAVKNLNEFRQKSLPFPKISIKIALIFLATLFFQLIFIFSSSARPALDYIPFLDKSLGFLIAFQIGLFNIPARMRNTFLYMLAQTKLQNYPDLKVVGITGSYGKTSVKEFTAQLLPQSNKIIKTYANNNTAVGVSKTIIHSVKKDTDVFILEAAAYSKGEIKDIAEVVKNNLEIAVITGLNAQHLDLFKKIENIAAAKYELVQSLSKNKTAIFNNNNIQTRKLALKAKKKGIRVLLYGDNKKCHTSAKNINQLRSSLEFTLTVGEKTQNVKTPLIGRHNVENILAAATVADELGVPWKKILSGIKKLTPPPATMKYQKKGNTVLIDDSYNANPDGVYAALNYLSIYKISKILVLRPLIELGSEAENVHKKAGGLAGKICDEIILTNNNYIDSFMAGVGKSNKGKVAIKSGKQAKEYINKKRRGKKVIVFEGRESETVLKEYISC